MAPKGFVEIEAWLVRETDKAILIDVEDSLKSSEDRWLPKSEVDYTEQMDGKVLVLIPEWLALKKGLV